MHPTLSEPEPVGSRLLPALVIAGAVAAAYANTLRAGFQFDDWSVIVDEPRVRTLTAWWASLPAIRPLLKLTYALNHSLPFGRPGFHLFNLATHLANSLLVFWLFTRLARREGWDSRRGRMMAMLGALLFALHPVQTEAVTYLSGRSSSLVAFFSLASLAAWIAGRSPERLRPARWRDVELRRRDAWLSVASAVLFALGLLVKETAAVVPLAILLWEAGNRPEAGATGDETSADGWFKVPWAHWGILAVALMVAAASPTYRFLLSTSVHARSLGSNLLTQAGGMLYLLGQLVRLDRMNADPALSVVTAWSVRVALQILLLVSLIGLGLISLRRRPPLAFGILWFFLFLAPTNSLLPRFDVANDRQLYLAILGPIWLALWWLGSHRGSRPVLPLAILIGAVLLAGFTTHRRNLVYTDEIAFWMDVTRKSPQNGRAFNNLGYAYALQARNAEAEQAFRRALALNPADTRAAVNLRLLLEGGLLGRPGPP